MSFLMEKIFKKRALWQTYPILFLFIFLPVVSLALVYYNSSTERLNEEYNKNNLNIRNNGKVQFG